MFVLQQYLAIRIEFLLVASSLQHLNFYFRAYLRWSRCPIFVVGIGGAEDQLTIIPNHPTNAYCTRGHTLLVSSFRSRFFKNIKFEILTSTYREGSEVLIMVIQEADILPRQRSWVEPSKRGHTYSSVLNLCPLFPSPSCVCLCNSVDSTPDL